MPIVRYVALLMTLIAYVVLSLNAVPLTVDLPLLALAATVSVAAVALIVLSRPMWFPALSAPSHGPPAEERRLRGSFRRQTQPDTAGRPMPRAPGIAAGALLRR